MKMRPLGSTGIEVSELCLGTMTFGNQTPAEEGHAQIEYAFDHGVNFMDTAEMYPVNPVKAETVGNTEAIIGDWFEKTGRRNDWILATKLTGPSQLVRDGARMSPDTMRAALEGSLKRLKTDVIDLYQLHWPNRGSYGFRQNWKYDPSKQNREETLQHMADLLGALQDEITRGTIRHVGLSNESAWGLTTWIRVAEKMGGPRMETVQNEYSLMYRMADTDLAEALINEGAGLLPYSPLGAGLLSGKYQNGALPEGSRMAINGDLGGRKTDRAFLAVDAYLEVAKKFGIDPVHMAFAWSARRPFVASSIFGATTMDQLKVALGASDVELSDELLAALDDTHKQHPFPF